ncbi:hypothetical protein CWI38_1298p0020 [Hamiltosporidium tvaerminnensis]|uniref:Uncharacterized protein n=1 Tax=Hamiltosporidium tvaerminnensis TaxID=1176355 RepID=A0A4Q9LSZ0_9MICR|nr:hypothetical protein CWI38_1298p0020 [Hamiltosporidium tvaerminnensis]
MSDSFSGKNTHEKKYHFYVDETPECIECENDLLVLEKYLSNNDQERIFANTFEGHSMLAMASMLRINYRRLINGSTATFNVDVSPSTIDRALRETNYATSFRELEVDNDDKNFVFLDEFGVAVVIHLSESAYLSVTPARSRIYHKIHERAINEEDFRLSIKISTSIFVIYNARIHHYLGLNDDEEIASYQIKYLPPYSQFFNLIENAFSV